jgi:hypothetical protein
MALNLLLLFDYVVAEHESNFGNRPGLVLIRARRTKGVSRRDAVRMNPRKISSHEETSMLKGRRHSHGRAAAARAVYQILG